MAAIVLTAGYAMAGAATVGQALVSPSPAGDTLTQAAVVDALPSDVGAAKETAETITDKSPVVVDVAMSLAGVTGGGPAVPHASAKDAEAWQEGPRPAAPSKR